MRLRLLPPRLSGGLACLVSLGMLLSVTSQASAWAATRATRAHRAPRPTVHGSVGSVSPVVRARSPSWVTSPSVASAADTPSSGTNPSEASLSPAAVTVGHGLSYCAVSGTLTFTPPEQTTATGNSTVGATFDASDCSGNDFTQSAKTITGATATSKGASPTVPADCPAPAFAPNSDTAASSFPKLRFKIAWTTSSGKIAASLFTMTNGLSTWTGADGPIASPTATQVLSFSGVSHASGSFSKPTRNLQAVKLTLDVAQDYDAQVTSTTTGCASSGGLAQITFTGTLLIP